MVTESSCFGEIPFLEAKKLIESVEPMLEGSLHFSQKWLDENHWEAIPIPDTFDELDTDRLSRMAKQVAAIEGFAILLEVDAEYKVYRVAWSSSNLLSFDKEFPLTNYLLIPENLGFAVIKEASYYFIIAGPANTIRTMVENSVDSARESFRNYANEDFWPDSIRIMLNEVADTYER
ncbi:MAG: hypothetical protein KDE50_15140 [Caldilineaceae bacterium]|nr:hypothetical protein [Caldilineaceae bacterium]MCB9148592.1 hypothetical protein [Caldilineaceae bacterium]